jgi:hypothetical protein
MVGGLPGLRAAMRQLYDNPDGVELIQTPESWFRNELKINRFIPSGLRAG